LKNAELCFEDEHSNLLAFPYVISVILISAISPSSLPGIKNPEDTDHTNGRANI